MTSPKEHSQAAMAERKRLRGGRILDGGLARAISHAGGELVGFSVKLSQDDCLVVLKADFPGGRMVGFVGGETLIGTLLKATSEAKGDHVRWRADRWVK